MKENSIYVTFQAMLLDDSKETASDWARPHIFPNEFNAYVLGRYAEADNANSNNQYFALKDLIDKQPTLNHAPLNINHDGASIGAFVASEVVYPTADAGLNPYMEALAVVWKKRYPDQYSDIAKAASMGILAFSMEAIPKALSTVGGTDDSIQYPYDGRTSASYPQEINERSCAVKLCDPHFVGGALILPPETPGWKDAHAEQVAKSEEDSLAVWQEVMGLILEAAA